MAETKLEGASRSHADLARCLGRLKDALRGMAKANPGARMKRNDFVDGVVALSSEGFLGEPVSRKRAFKAWKDAAPSWWKAAGVFKKEIRCLTVGDLRLQFSQGREEPSRGPSVPPSLIALMDSPEWEQMAAEQKSTREMLHRAAGEERSRSASVPSSLIALMDSCKWKEMEAKQKSTMERWHLFMRKGPAGFSIPWIEAVPDGAKFAWLTAQARLFEE